jgi:hypothetical protein
MSHKIAILDDASSKLIPGAFRLETVPPYHSELGPCQSTTDTLRL